MLRDKFLEDLGILSDESRYPHLELLKATQLQLGYHVEVEKEKGQREKNAFNGWSRSYMKEHPNLQGEAGYHEFVFNLLTSLF